jgi:hypothetical protein
MKKLFTSASALAVAITLIIAAPTSSQAAQMGIAKVKSIQPYSAQSCSGNTCMFLSTPLGGTVTVQGWAYGTSFYGYFYLTAPSGTYYSATKTWLGAMGNWAQWSNIPAIVGQYCVTGYSSTGIFEGTVCNSVY